jgi:hypothetical protein
MHHKRNRKPAMSTPFYDLASLVVLPSGYKSQKIYAQKPLTTDGQLTFTRASTATRVNASGLIETVSSGVPRLDYTNSSCPKILLEPQRSNLALQSEALNTTWTDFGTGTTVTANATTAPDGTSTADLVQFPTASGSTQYVLAQVLTLTTGVPHTISFYAKTQTGTASNLVVRLNGAEAALGQTITTTWQRFTKTLTPLTASDDSGFKNRPAVSGNGAAINVYIWGVQIEAGAYATSYIPTTTAAVTRLADYCSKTSSTIAADAKTWFCDANITEGTIEGLSEMYLTIRGGAYEGYFRYFTNNSLQIQYYGASGSVQISLNSAVPVGTTARVKMAARIENNNFAFYVNGVQIGTNTTATRGTGMNLLEIGTYGIGAGYHISDSINQVLLFPTALTNAQLAELTTL